MTLPSSHVPHQAVRLTQTAHVPAVVVVDHEPDVAIILHRLLRDLLTTCDIILAHSSHEVLLHLQQRPTRLVIADYNMPVINGLQLSVLIKLQSPRTRIMLITADDTPTLEREARAKQVDYYLPKPFDFNRFEQLVREALT